MDYRIELVEGDEYRREHYGIEYTSAYLYRTKGNSGPTRVQVWSNTRRPNPHPGETRHGAMGPIGGEGRYLDPQNQGTDEEFTVLLSPESTVISAHGDGTGTAASGQVYAKDHPPLETGDVLTLEYPDGREERRIIALTDNYGRGRADRIPDEELGDALINASARFMPCEGDGLPCVEIGGVQVYVYFADGELRVSTHYDTAYPEVLTEAGTVPTRVSIGGDVEYFQG